MSQLLFIAIGGAAGALARFWASNAFNGLHHTGFPFATLGVNAIGSFAMGVLYV